MPQSLAPHFEFLKKIEGLREITRHNLVLDGTRCENSAEHSWHLALYALAFAPHAADDVNITRVVTMLLIHDIVEIEVGDHPIHEDVDWAEVERRENVAAARIFGLLPDGARYLAMWQEFEADQSADARFAKALDRLQPLVQSLCGAPRLPNHLAICRENLETGRARSLQERLPDAYLAMTRLLENANAPLDGDLSQQLAFVNEADKLKHIQRATRIGAGTRQENSGEHSWHIAMFALILADFAETDIAIDRVLQMVLLHDLVEIDAGDVPIHAAPSADQLAALEAEEQAAAHRIFGLLPKAQGDAMLAIWQEFEAAESNDARFAKSMDRVQPVLLNLMTNGGSWVEYDVHLPQLEARVGDKVRRGSLRVWLHLLDEITPWFQAHDRL